jgi:hypothetical protein
LLLVRAKSLKNSLEQQSDLYNRVYAQLG